MAWFEVTFSIRSRNVPGNHWNVRKELPKKCPNDPLRSFPRVADYRRTSSREEIPSSALWRAPEVQWCFHWCSALFQNVPSMMCNPAVRKLQPPTCWYRGLKRSWEVNNILTVSEQIACGNRYCWLLWFLQLAALRVFMMNKSPLGPTEIAKGLGATIKRMTLGRLFYSSSSCSHRSRTGPCQEESKTGSEGYDYVYVIFKIWNACRHKGFTFLFTGKALRGGQSVNKVELY